MTAQPVEETPDDGWSGYSLALATLTAGAVAETGHIFDRLVPPGLLVEELPEPVRSLLVQALGRSWLVWRARGASLAAVSLAGWLSSVRREVVAPVFPPPPSADRDRLRHAAETLVERVANLQVGAEDADVEAMPDEDFDAALQAVADRAAAEAHVETLARTAAADDERARRAIEAGDAAERETTARFEARRRADEAALRAASRETDRRETDRVARTEAAVTRQRRADRAARTVADEAARRDARRERRRAQMARAQNVARAEAAAAAAAILAQPVPALAIAGWVRKIDNDPCARCLHWYNAGGDPRGPTPVRPYSVPMKRHAGCTCIQRPVTQGEADARGTTTDPESTARGLRHDRPADPGADGGDDEFDDARDAPGGHAGSQ